MRFLFVSAFECDEDTGAAGSLIAIGNALHERGHEVDYLWAPGRRYSFLHPSLTRLFDLPRRQYQQVADRLQTTRYDAVIISQPYAFLIYERLASIYPHTLFLNRTHGWEARVYESNRQLRWDRRTSFVSSLMSGCSAKVMKWWCARVAKSCHGLISPASRCAKYIQTTCDINRDKVTTISYGLPAEYLKAALPRETGGRRMLFVGQYLPRKGTSVLETVLPEIANKYPDATLTFVIQQDAIERVKSRYAPSFGDRLAVHQWMERARLIGIYRNHHLFLYPSLFEGFGKTALEAMACGLCVVGFDEGGLSDIAANEKEALFCETGDTDSFRELLERCLQDTDFAKEVGDRAAALSQNYPWSRTAEETERFCMKLSGDRAVLRNGRAL